MSYLGKRKGRVEIQTSAQYTGAKNLAQSDSSIGQSLGNQLFKKYLDQNKTAALDFNIFGNKVEVVIGEKAQEYGKIVKAFPQVYGKTKTKNYDFLIPIASINRQNIQAAQGVYMGKLKELAGDAYADLAQGTITNFQDLMNIAVTSNSRLMRSFQWYILNQRSILNAKIQLTIYCKGTTAIAVDYIDEIGGKDPAMSINDKLVFVKCGNMSDEISSDSYLKDLSKLSTELQNNVIQGDMLKQFVNENQTKLMDKVNKLMQGKVDSQIYTCKVGYLPFVKRLLIASDQPALQATLHMKIYYRQDIFEPYHQYLTSQIVPKQVYGTVAMFKGDGQYQEQYKLALQNTQELVVKGSQRRLSKLNYALANQALFTKVFQDRSNMWHYILEDWAVIALEAIRETKYAKYKKYNKGMLKSFQQLYMSSPQEFANVLESSGQVITQLLTKYQQGFIQGQANLTVAYNNKQQGGASDNVTYAILVMLAKVSQDNNIQYSEPRQPRQNRGQGGNNNQGSLSDQLEGAYKRQNIGNVQGEAMNIGDMM